MSKFAMTQMEAIAVLMNGGHIVWRQPRGPGRSSYKVYLPGGSDPDQYVGRLDEVTVERLWKAGFIDVGFARSDDSGDVLTVLKLSKPNLPFFTLSKEVPGND